jgi:peptidyl-prolyl cis-trans isomerase-like protein 2
MQVLDSLERVPVDDNERPIEDIKIIAITVLVDPFAEGLYGQAEGQVQEVAPEDNTPWLKRSSQSAGAVGKYLNTAKTSTSGGNVASGIANASDKKVRATTSISKSNFAGW